MLFLERQHQLQMASDADEFFEENYKAVVGAFIEPVSSDSSGGESNWNDGDNSDEIYAAMLSTEWIGYDHSLVQKYILENKPNEFKESINLQGEIPIPGGGRYGKDGRADIVDTGTGNWAYWWSFSFIYNNIRGISIISTKKLSTNNINILVR